MDGSSEQEKHHQRSIIHGVVGKNDSQVDRKLPPSFESKAGLGNGGRSCLSTFYERKLKA